MAKRKATKGKPDSPPGQGNKPGKPKPPRSVVASPGTFRFFGASVRSPDILKPPRSMIASPGTFRFFGASVRSPAPSRWLIMRVATGFFRLAVATSVSEVR